MPRGGKDTVYLKTDQWNDYSFVTVFEMSFHDEDGKLHDIGQIKIGFKGQTTEIPTYARLDSKFEKIGDEFFSLGQGVEYYRKIASLPYGAGRNILESLRDIVAQPHLIDEVKTEDVFSVAFLRGVSLSVIKGQYLRVLEGQAELTDFNFAFLRPESDNLGEIELSFGVKVGSTPSTNIHAVIGRNGVGKTTLLNGMIGAITDKENANGQFFDQQSLRKNVISADYFSSLVSVSFSAFDPFAPPQEQSDPAMGTCYFYIGLKDSKNREQHRTISDLQIECVKALINCFYQPKKKKRWFNAIEKLGSDENFRSMQLEQLEAIYEDLRCDFKLNNQSNSEEFQNKYHENIVHFLDRMSSGHAVVLLTITRLVATVEEKTLILLDEPESHLHPPLLSAFVRAIADLLSDQNGVAIIATHSPVVLQEIPSSCVWKLYRSGSSVTSNRPQMETFGENVGVLTSEVFSLEVERSGFHDLLDKSVKAGKSYERILADYGNQLGFEGKAILKSLIGNRDRSNDHDAIE